MNIHTYTYMYTYRRYAVTPPDSYVYRYTYMYMHTYMGICTHISDMCSLFKTSFFWCVPICFEFCPTWCRGTLRSKLTRSASMRSAVPTVWESRARVGRNRLTNQGLAVLPQRLLRRMVTLANPQFPVRKVNVTHQHGTSLPTPLETWICVHIS